MTIRGSSKGKSPAAKVRVFERVRDAVLDDIRAGELSSGDRLPSERELSQKYSVSRSAVREGLRALETSGVLRFAKGTKGGAFVREKSVDGIARSLRDMITLGQMPLSDIMVVRRNLLLLALDLAVDRGTEADFSGLEDNVERLKAAIETGDPLATVEPVMEFNCLLGSASHNPVLELVVDTVSAIMADLLQELKLPTHIDLISPRRAIIGHLRSRNAEAAKELLARHLSDTTKYVLESAVLIGSKNSS